MLAFRGALGTWPASACDADARRERGPDDRAAHDTRRGSRKRSDPPSCEAQGGSGVGTKRRSASVMPARVIKAAADVSPIDAFGGKVTREHRIRVRSQQSERLHRVTTRGAASPRSFPVPKCLNTATLGAAGHFAGLAAHQIGGVLEQLGV